MSLVKVLLGLTALLVALSFVSAYDFNSLPQLFSEGFVVESESDHHMTLFNMKDKRTIVLNKNPNPLDVLTEKITKHKNKNTNNVKTASLKAALGDEPENTVPVFKGAVKPDGSITTWGAPCFQKYSAQLKLDDTTAYITLNADEPKSLFCNDWLLFLSRGSFSVKNVFFRGKSTIEIKMKPDEIQDVTANGIFVFNFPDGLFGTIVDLWNVYQIFDGKHMEADNVKFLSRTMNMAFNPRTNNTLIIPDESTIDDGDYIAVTRLDGLDPLIMYGTGGHIGHTAVFLRFDGELYVCESTDKNPFGQSYWPPPYGIIRTPYRQWLQQAANAGYIVAFAKLAPELRAKFNSDAARAWFLNGIQGLPYGYHNFIFGWIDTVDQNYPYPLSAQLVVAALPILEKFIPANISGIFIVGINKRLEYYYNVTSAPCEDVFCLYSRLDSLGLTFAEVVTLVEHDEWKYYDGYSMVCDVFVLEMYKTAGIFDPALAAQIQATEFSPKDVYQMQIFDTTWVAPAACQVPGFSTNFCQLLGDYWWPLPEFNSVPVYPHMNEHCGAMPPQYVRGPAGC